MSLGLPVRGRTCLLIFLSPPPGIRKVCSKIDNHGKLGKLRGLDGEAENRYPARRAANGLAEHQDPHQKNYGADIDGLTVGGKQPVVQKKESQQTSKAKHIPLKLLPLVGKSRSSAGTVVAIGCWFGLRTIGNGS